MVLAEQTEIDEFVVTMDVEVVTDGVEMVWCNVVEISPLLCIAVDNNGCVAEAVGIVVVGRLLVETDVFVEVDSVVKENVVAFKHMMRIPRTSAS